ncbi:MAG: YbaB/EbfC family nucleoid-associated protein [bacterium]|nr:YbaB/EbfC family nucleoid-associated protein [bacterium]
MFNKLKQFKDLRSKAKEITQTLSQETVEGTAGWGKVKIKMDGNQKILAVTIDASVLSDKTKLEELIREAGNDAIQKIQKVMSAKIKDIGGLDLASQFGDALKK